MHAAGQRRGFAQRFECACRSGPVAYRGARPVVGEWEHVSPHAGTSAVWIQARRGAPRRDRPRHGRSRGWGKPTRRPGSAGRVAENCAPDGLRPGAFPVGRDGRRARCGAYGDERGILAMTPDGLLGARKGKADNSAVPTMAITERDGSGYPMTARALDGAEAADASVIRDDPGGRELAELAAPRQAGVRPAAVAPHAGRTDRVAMNAGGAGQSIREGANGRSRGTVPAFARGSCSSDGVRRRDECRVSCFVLAMIGHAVRRLRVDSVLADGCNRMKGRGYGNVGTER